MTEKITRAGSAFLAGVLVLLFAQASPHASPPPFEKFFGAYEGDARSAAEGELSERDLSVKITPYKDGFSVNWVSVEHKADGRTKRKEYSVIFQPTAREAVYGSGKQTNASGEEVPLDPLLGDPYVWARVEGSTLFVYAVRITDGGGYEVQIYERALVPDGMNLTYWRVRDGALVRTVTGKLSRVK